MTEFTDHTGLAGVEYTVIDANGQIMSIGGGPCMPTLPEGLEAIPGHPPSEDYYRDGDSWVPIPPKPREGFQMDWEAKEWYDARDLETEKASLWDIIKRNRDRAEFATFPVGAYEFDCDPTSRARIQGAMQLAQMDPDYKVYWTLADNRIVQLDAADLEAVAVQLGIFTAALHQHAAGVRIEINEATSLAELDAIPR